MSVGEEFGEGVGDRTAVFAVVFAESESDRTAVEVHEERGAEQSSPSGLQEIPRSDRRLHRRSPNETRGEIGDLDDASIPDVERCVTLERVEHKWLSGPGRGGRSGSRWRFLGCPHYENRAPCT